MHQQRKQKEYNWGGIIIWESEKGLWWFVLLERSEGSASAEAQKEWEWCYTFIHCCYVANPSLTQDDEKNVADPSLHRMTKELYFWEQ